MELFKIIKDSDSDKLTDSTATGYKTPVDVYAYYDTTTKLFYIDAEYPGTTGVTRQPINAYKATTADMATLANAAVYETGPNTNDPLHKINEYYGHSLSLSNHELSLIAGDGTTSLGSIGLVSKSSDGLTPQLPNENTVSKFLRQDGTWAGGSIPVAEVDSTSTSTAFTA